MSKEESEAIKQDIAELRETGASKEENKAVKQEFENSRKSQKRTMRKPNKNSPSCRPNRKKIGHRCRHCSHILTHLLLSSP